MWTKFGIFLATSGLIHQVKCTNIPYSDMFLPSGTNGFVCGIDLFKIDHLRQVAEKAMESTFFEIYYSRFPKLFEDTHLFNVKSDILLSCPVMLNELFFHATPGLIRLIINIRGQIMGMVIVISKYQDQEVTYEKCSPTHRSLEEGNAERRKLNENSIITRPRLGYGCGLGVISESTVYEIMRLASTDYFRQRLEGRGKLAHLEKYTGDKFVGVNLYSFPVRRKTYSKVTSGRPGRFRVIFDMASSEVLGIIDVVEANEICATLWDLSSTLPETIYSPSSILDLDRVPDTFWPEACFGRHIKTKTMWLYLEFAMKNWKSNFNSRALSFPILKQKIIRLWPMRIPETNIPAVNDIFAIGYNTRSRIYSLYHAQLRDGILSNYEACLEFSPEIIHHLQGIFGPATES
ncbi:CSEP0331 putative effector protein [Blumeria hordei DH14]|uniref:CSEP0331 putative effector protein n=1 Tax=Blumeria graminis f. sp. hordei (strain DH14) TaxID=546991 RepID=N1J7Y1_BLUG1|nr:CSEP0331 putative effector protein [Blumeria hordei DH14]